MIYLVRTNNFSSSSSLVVISLVSSLWSIVSKLVADDKLIVITKARSANFKFSKIVVFDVAFVSVVFAIGCSITFVVWAVALALCVVFGSWIWLLYVSGVLEKLFDFLGECWESMTDPYGEVKERKEKELQKQLQKEARKKRRKQKALEVEVCQ